MNHITYSVKSLTLPTMMHTPIEFKHKGLTIPIRGVTKFSQSFEVTFYLVENHINKRFFEEWMAMIEQRHYYYNPRKQAVFQNNLAVTNNQQPESDLPNFMTWYNVTAYIEQYNFDGDLPTASYEIFNVFPTNVTAPQYSYDSVGQIGEFTVTFACSHYKLHSKGWRNGQAIQTQLFHTTNKRSVMGEWKSGFENGDNSYMVQEGEYNWPETRFARIGQFENLDQTAEKHQEVYWRPYEFARWDNHWNRWRETYEGANRNGDIGVAQPGNGISLDYDYDEIEELPTSLDEILRKKYKEVQGYRVETV